MAAPPSAHNEERNLLRLRAWEQRNQETSQAKEPNHETVPLFGEPYKTNKGDELSNRIQRMLGSYEDVSSPPPVAMEPLPIPSYVTFLQSDRGQMSTDHQTKPPFLNQGQYAASQSQKAPSGSSYSSQSTRTSASPNQYGNSSSFSSNASQLSHSTQQQQKSEAHSYLREHDNLFQEMPSQSPDAKGLPFLHSTKQENTDTHSVDTFDRHQLEGSTHHPSECSNADDIPTFNPKQSPKDLPVTPANKGSALPSQTFSSLLSKQPSVVMTQKPTAYVRPMDGQDQVVSESPELKPSPEPYVPLPDLINKADPGKEKMLPQFLETRTNEAQCVEDILREMTCSWPPVLTAIKTPSTAESSKSPLSTREAQHVSSCSGQKKLNASPADSSQHTHQSSSPSLDAAHSRVGKCPSSSDSESSSRSESDSESIAEEQLQHPVNSSVKTEPDAPGANQVDWQLGNWIRPSQQSSGTEGPRGSHPSQSPAHKQPEPSQSLMNPSLEVAEPTKGSKPHLSTERDFSDSWEKPQKYTKTSQGCYKQQSNQTPPSGDLNNCSRKLSCATVSSKPAKVDCADAALSVKHKEVVAMLKKDPNCLHRPKVKTKTGHRKRSKERSDTKRDSKRSSKHKSHEKQRAAAQPEAASAPYGHCPSCSVQYPNPCSCPTQSPAQPDQLPLSSPVTISCSKPKSEPVCPKGSKSPHKRPQKHRGKTGHGAKGSHASHRPPTSLLVKIDLSLLSRVPQTSGIHQESLGKAKRSEADLEQSGQGGSKATSAAQKPTKTSRKNIPQNVEVDEKTIPRKKPRLENKSTSSSHTSVKPEGSGASAEDLQRKKAKKNPLRKDSKSHKHSSGETRENCMEARKSKDPCKKRRSSGKHTEQPHSDKSSQKSQNSSSAVPSSSQKTRELPTNRPLLRFDDRQHPVKHYIKEAKRLKHKADAECDKFRKGFSYLEAAMYFVETGIAIERDAQISMSSYTMFAETVELLKYVVRLINSVVLSTPPLEKDFLALCFKCHSLLTMAMFRHKHKTALKYSKTLYDHFRACNPAQKTHNPSVLTPKGSDTPSPLPSMPSPAITSNSCGGSGLPADLVSSSGGGGSGSSVSLPLAIQQTAFSYVNITTLFLSAYETWDHAEKVALSGSGLLRELDAVMGPLSLSSSMVSMVRYIRQGVDWLRLDSQKGS